MSPLDLAVGGVAPAGAAGAAPTRALEHRDFGTAFEDLLTQLELETPEIAQDVSGVKFSRHARARLESRGIEMDDEALSRLDEGVSRLAEKGAQESLVLMDDSAFIVGVPKRTVITAMSRSEAMGQVFTAIDSTLVL
jgi:flagellar operon protein